MTHTKFMAAAACALSGVLALTSVPPAEAASVGYVKAVVGLGDSYPSGAMGNEGRSYVNRYGSRTSQRTLNWAYSGWQTGDVLYQMQNTPVEMRNIRDARTVIITIGANDIMQRYPDPSVAATSAKAQGAELWNMRRRLHTILGMVSKARGGNNSRVVVTTYNNIYLDGAPLRAQTPAWRNGAVRLTGQVNSVIMAECAAYKMACVNVEPSFHTSATSADKYVIADGSHPNANGHQLYANLIYNRVH